MDRKVTTSWMILRVIFTAVPIIAGLDKFTDLLTRWDAYLNPTLAGLLPFSPHVFMAIVGVIEIIAGFIVFARPRVGGYIVMAWLICIALSLIASGRYLDVAVRDLVMAAGAFICAYLTPVAVANEYDVNRREGKTLRNRVTVPMVIIAAVLAGTGTAVSGSKPAVVSPVDRIDQSVFKRDMRKLWEEHITWTRLYIISALADLPDQEAAAGRLLRNQADIGNAVKPVYGNAAGEQLTGLLRDHILIAADLVGKVKGGDTLQSKLVMARWYANADSIANFLSTANPGHWPYEEMRSMMHSHLALTTAEVTSRLQKDWQADIAAYGKVHDQILSMADMLSSGIISQFPKAFR